MTTTNDQIARRFWDREVHDPTGSNWMADPQVRAYINRSISGSPNHWPMDFLVRWLAGRKFRRGLSIGCGGGGLERDLMRRGVCEQIDAFDGSEESIRVAKTQAAAEGFGERIRYWVGDFNEPRLPAATYDVVFVHQAMHHVSKLEKLYRAILSTLTPDGLLYLDEYVGPSRHEWDDASFAPYRRIFETLPRKVRKVDHVPLPIQPHDPSEAIRSSEILPQLAIGFDVIERRDYGGNVLASLFDSIRPYEETVWFLIDEEERVLRAGTQSFMTVVIARPKRGFGAVLAKARYFAVPKVQRVLREIRARTNTRA